MSTAKTILGIVPGLQATALVGHNLKLIPNFKKPLKSKPKKFIKTSVGTILGVGLIKPTASMINQI